MKELSLVHDRIVNLHLLETLHFPIKSIFVFQGWANIFPSIPKNPFDPLIRLFYANLYFFRFSKLKTIVMGTRIFLDCAMFDAIFGINCSCFTTGSKILGHLTLTYLLRKKKYLLFWIFQLPSLYSWF